MSGRLNHRVALVTGAASGLGKAIALRFADEGAWVLACDLQREPLEGGSTVEELLGTRGLFIEADVTRWDDNQRMVERALERTGRLDVSVLSAGITGGPYSRGLLETPEEGWDLILNVNLKGVFLGMKAAVAQMVKQEVINEVRGRVIALSSQQGLMGPPGTVAYAASKGGVVNLVHQVAVDFGPRGILVNAVAPGKVITGRADGMIPESLAYSRSRTPFHRLGRPDDVTGPAVFLASDDSLYVSGTNLLVDGGWMAY